MECDHWGAKEHVDQGWPGQPRRGSRAAADEHAVFVACEKNFRPAQLASDRVIVKTLEYLSHEERPEGSGNWGAAAGTGRGLIGCGQWRFWR